MVLGGAMVGLVNWYSGMYDLWLDSLLVDDWLNGLVYVMMDMLTSRCRQSGLRMMCLDCAGGILEFSGFTSETLFRLILIIVVELAVFNWDHVV